ncbi:zinc finger protein [Sigmodon hispidus]
MGQSNEIGDEEDAAAQALVTVNEVTDEEELNMEEMVKKNSNSLLTLDELIDQDDCISHTEPKDVTVLSMTEEQDLQQERLVTVDEIGEVEESADITFATLNSKRDEGTTDDRSDFHLVTLDEVTEEDEDSLVDFKNLKEELNFVTVDEVGDEEDGDNDSKVELAQGKIDDRTGPGSETVIQDLKTMIERPTAVEAELKDSEPDEKRRKTRDEDSSVVGKSVTPNVPGDLDFLVPKAGFFCPICSLFYSDEKAMANHCKSTHTSQAKYREVHGQAEKGEGAE